MAWWWIATSWEWRSRAQSPPQSACRTSCGTRSGDRTIRGSRSVPCQRSRTVARWPWSPSTGRSSPSHFVPVDTRNRGSSVNSRESERLRDCESARVCGSSATNLFKVRGLDRDFSSKHAARCTLINVAPNANTISSHDERHLLERSLKVRQCIDEQAWSKRQPIASLFKVCESLLSRDSSSESRQSRTSLA